MGEQLQVEIDVSDDDEAPDLVWAAAVVDRIDLEREQFYVRVTEWDSLPEDDDEPAMGIPSTPSAGGGGMMATAL